MTSRIGVLLLVGVMTCSTGCTSFGELKALMAETQRASDLLEKDLGMRPQIGGHIVNGKLTVNVTLDSAAVQQLSVSTLEGRVHRALAAALTDKPQEILLVLRATTFNTAGAAASMTVEEPTAGQSE